MLLKGASPSRKDHCGNQIPYASVGVQCKEDGAPSVRGVTSARGGEKLRMLMMPRGDLFPVVLDGGQGLDGGQVPGRTLLTVFDPGVVISLRVSR